LSNDADDGIVRVEVLSPRGSAVFSTSAALHDSVAAIDWQVPRGTVGGEYSVKASVASYYLYWTPPATRTFSIRAYRPPRITITVEFGRQGFAPGDTATAIVLAQRAEGGACTGGVISSAKASFTTTQQQLLTAVLVGTDMKPELPLGPSGGAVLSFAVPDDSVSGTLSLTIEDGGVVEAITKTVPVISNNSPATVKLFPESGTDIAEGVLSRVYFEATNTWGDPVDVAGNVVSVGNSKSVARFKTAHEGRGVFEFTPEPNTLYKLVFSQPSGLAPIELRPASRSTVTLRALKEVFDAKDNVAVTMTIPPLGEPTRLIVGLFQRERMLSAKTLAFEPSQSPQVHKLELTAGPGVSGVLRVTVFDGNKGENGQPLAERLIFRKPASTLRLKVTPDATRYNPGAPVKLLIRAEDAATGKPVKAYLGVSVTDASVLDMIDPRHRQPRLPAMALLEHEVMRIGDSGAFFSEKGVASGEAIDLLLGVQEWRRFGFCKPEEFVSREGDRALNVLGFNNAPPPMYPFLNMRKGGGKQWGAPMDDAIVATAVPMPETTEIPQPLHAVLTDVQKEEDVAEGAQQQQEEAKPHERSNFVETVLWRAGMMTDDSGLAEVEFRLSDQITSFAVLVDGFTRNGLLGFADTRLESHQPFYLAPKVPLHLTVGDHAIVPVSVINDSPNPLYVALTATTTAGLTFYVPPTTTNSADLASQHVKTIQQSLRLDSEKRSRQLLEVDATAATNESAFFSVNAKAGQWADAIKLPIAIYPRGFPVDIDNGGVITAINRAEFSVEVPQDAKNIATSLLLYPTPAANLQQALEALIREPFGCFEQASSTTYPAVMAAQYFNTHGVAASSPAAKKAQEVLAKGYKKLTGYETKGGGFEWFGRSPAHESLTAYGLLEFIDMAKVFPVDPALLQRTKQWLLGRRSNDGTAFLRDSRLLDSFGAAPDSITNAYIVWSLTFAGIREGLEGQIAALNKQSETSEDAYFLGLVAGINANIGEHTRAKALGHKLMKHQFEDGRVSNAETSITRSGGDPLLIETTSISVLSWLPYEEFSGAIERAMGWLATRCKDGKFGSTQGTVLALKAIIAYDLQKQRQMRPFTVALEIDDRQVEEIVFDPQVNPSQATGPLAFSEAIARELTSGKGGRHAMKLSLRCRDDTTECPVRLPFSFHVRYFTDVPPSDPDPELSLAVSASAATVREGATVQIRVVLANNRQTAQGMSIAIVGMPGGLEVRHDKLKELVSAGHVDFFETLSNGDVVLYWRSLAPRGKVDIQFDAQAAVPGTYVGSASRGYPYYFDSSKSWVSPLQIRITHID